MRPREGLLVRPLLEFTREQTATYCIARGLTWREDESNDSDAYARNRIRSALVPTLEAVHPGAVENVIAVSEILHDEAAVLDALVDEVLERGDRVELSRLRGVEPALARLVVQRLADRAAGGPAPGVARRAAEILALDEHGTAQLDTGGGVVAIAEYGVLRFESRASRSAGTTPEPVLLAIPGSAMFGGQEVRCELGRPRASRASSIERPSVTTCWCDRGGPVTGWRRSGFTVPRASRICSRRAGSRGASAGLSRWSSQEARSCGWRASPPPSTSRSPTRPRRRSG